QYALQLLMLNVRHNWVAAAICGSLVAAVGALLLSLFGSGMHSTSYDLLFLPRKPIKPTEAVVVYMDNQSHEVLKQPLTAPWDRELHARLIERLTKAGAKVIVFDVHFSGASDPPEATAHLARAIKAHGAVVLGVDNERVADPSAAGPRAILPYELLADAAAELGSVEVRPDNDLVIRRHLSTGRDDFFPPLSWAAAKLFGAPPS